MIGLPDDIARAQGSRSQCGIQVARVSVHVKLVRQGAVVVVFANGFELGRGGLAVIVNIIMKSYPGRRHANAVRRRLDVDPDSNFDHTGLSSCCEGRKEDEGQERPVRRFDLITAVYFT